ncbi:putative membrane protein [Pantoea agglomerans]|nr:putative membrane protein [Pantoea agglomerans]
MNILIELIATVLYICVLFPFYIVCTIFYMMLCIMALPLKIPAINIMVTKYLKQEK